MYQYILTQCKDQLADLHYVGLYEIKKKIMAEQQKIGGFCVMVKMYMLASIY